MVGLLITTMLRLLNDLINPEFILVVRLRKAFWISDSGQSLKDSIISLIQQSLSIT